MVVVRKGWADLTVVVAVAVVAAAVVASDHQRTPGKPKPGRGVEGGDDRPALFTGAQPQVGCCKLNQNGPIQI